MIPSKIFKLSLFFESILTKLIPIRKAYSIWTSLILKTGGDRSIQNKVGLGNTGNTFYLNS